MHECVYVCVRACACDVICQSGDHEEPSWRRQYASLDVCTQKTPSLCLKDRTVPQTAMDSNFGASAKLPNSWRAEEGTIPNGYYMATEVENTAKQCCHPAW